MLVLSDVAYHQTLDTFKKACDSFVIEEEICREQRLLSLSYEAQRDSSRSVDVCNRSVPAASVDSNMISGTGNSLQMRTPPACPEQKQR
jgi:hypothetical protein